MPKLTALFAATTLVAGIMVVHLWQQLHAERKLVAQLQQERLVQPELPSAAPAIAPVVVTQSMPQAVPAAATAQVTPTPTPVAMPAPVPAGLNQTAISINQSAMRMLFPDLDKVLGLSPEEANSVVQLLLRNAPPAEVEAQIGAARAQQLQEYQKTLESRRRMNDLKNTLAQSSFPLSDAQIDRLAPASRAEQVRRDEELRARVRPSDPRAQLDFDEETIKATEASYGRVIATARSILTPEQLGIMQNTMNSVVTSQRTNLQTRRARLAAGGIGAAGTSTPAASGAEVPFIIINQTSGTGQAVPVIRP